MASQGRILQRLFLAQRDSQYLDAFDRFRNICGVDGDEFVGAGRFFRFLFQITRGIRAVDDANDDDEQRHEQIRQSHVSGFTYE